MGEVEEGAAHNSPRACGDDDQKITICDFEKSPKTGFVRT